MKVKEIVLVWNLGMLPFHVGYCDTPHNEGCPDVMGFLVGFDENLGLLTQIPDEGVASALTSAYKKGSQICASMGEPGLGEVYCNDFYSFIKESLTGKEINGLKILEIGCGKGNLLKILKNDGAGVLGIEPSEPTQTVAKKTGIKILRGEFDPTFLTDRFDIILHYGVLEHVTDIRGFMSGQLSVLTHDGVVIFSVPDCTEQIERGDISMFAHEHISYFTEVSLEKLASSIGAKTIVCRKASKGGAIYSVWKKGDREGADAPARIRDFIGIAKGNLKVFSNFLQKILERKLTLGVYCPGRFINYHYLFRDKMPRTRYFDDNPPAQGKYYPPIDVIVEPRARLLKEPTDIVLIMSRSFGKAILESLANEPALKKTTLLLIEELF